MSYTARSIDIEPAITDLRNRTLSRLPGDFSRLVYLASSRDLNSGHYSHDGLAFHFSETVASKAMAACHTEIFDRLVFCSLQQLIEELQRYIASITRQARLGDLTETSGVRSPGWTIRIAIQVTLPMISASWA